MKENTNTSIKAEKFWDRTADYYDKEEKKDELTYLKFIEKTRKYLKASDIVSATPYMGEKPILNTLFSIGSKIGITPEIKSFKTDELDNLFFKGNFEIVETDFLKQNSPQYLLIAKKLKSI